MSLDMKTKRGKKWERISRKIKFKYARKKGVQNEKKAHAQWEKVTVKIIASDVTLSSQLHKLAFSALEKYNLSFFSDFWWLT